MKKKKMRKRKISLKTEVKKERDNGSRGILTIKKEKDIKTERIDTEEESHKKSKKKKKKHKKEKKKDKKTSKEKILEREIKEIKQELDIKQERESDDDCGPSPSKRRKKIGNSVSPCFCYCCCRLWFMGFTPSHLNQFEILCIAGNRRYRYNGF